jgi:hypothetical protein
MNRGGQSGKGYGRSCFTDSLRRSSARNDMDFDWWCLVDSHDAIVMEVALDDLPIENVDFAPERRRESEN